jgi:hypothetical protein
VEAREVPMAMWFQIILSASIILITVFLVQLLIQARRTAASVQRFAESASEDLHQAVEDVHEIRVRTDEVLALAKHSLEHQSLLSQLVSGFVSGFRGSSARQSNSERWMETLVTSLRAALYFIRGRQEEPRKEESHE